MNVLFLGVNTNEVLKPTKMTDETRESYDSGEVVWVKLGSSWWPGEVKNVEELPSEVLDFKKPPLVIVKFFDEDS